MFNKLESISETIQPYLDRNKGTLWQVIKAYQANKRQGTVGVKTRAMVKSTGKKPFKQKKTGSARRGSFVAPLHVGGGVAHGPVARDYREAIPKKMSKIALGMVLASKLQKGQVFVGQLDVSSGKTKDAFQTIKTVIDLKNNSALVCMHNPSSETLRACKNLNKVRLASAEQLSALDLLGIENLIISAEAYKVLESRLSR